MARLEIRALSKETWDDFEALFGERGACGGCWCMMPRLPRKEAEAGKGDRNRRAMRALVKGGRRTGYLAYEKGECLGWCSVEPRELLPALARSRVLAPIDEEPVWSIVCLFVRKDRRRSGFSARMLDAVCRQAKKDGARIIEAYPVEPYTEKMPDAFAWTGIASAYLKAGFAEAARRSAGRPIMRRVLVAARGRRKTSPRGRSRVD